MRQVDPLQNLKSLESRLCSLLGCIGKSCWRTRLARALQWQIEKLENVELSVPLFTNTLKKENEVIELGLELLRAYQADSEQGHALDPENLRAATYALQCLLDYCHLRKEHSLLLPALLEAGSRFANHPKYDDLTQRQSEISADCGLLELRGSIEAFEQDPGKQGFFYCALSQAYEQISKQLELDHVLFQIAEDILDSDEQKLLYNEAKKIEQARGRDDRQSSRQIFNDLRLRKGMSVA